VPPEPIGSLASAEGRGVERWTGKHEIRSEQIQAVSLVKADQPERHAGVGE